MRISIRAKLIGLGLFTAAVIVMFLTAYLTATNTRHLRAYQLARAQTYARLLSAQLRSAVAFDDRETAREVLSFTTTDDTIAATRLYVDRGDLLFESGTPSPWTALAHRGVEAQRVITTSDRITIVNPIESLEGPRGVLVLELSRRSEKAYRWATIRSAGLIGLLALAFGTASAFLIARSLTRRLRAIAQIASAVAQQPESAGLVTIQSRDEIASLSSAFNDMLAAIREKHTALAATVVELEAVELELERANRDLEERVELRTFELRDANARLQGEMAARAMVEVELRQAQKLESVGRLASGIAHELNTPIQYVTDSCTFLETALSDVVQLAGTQQATLAQLETQTIDPATAITRIRTAEVEADLPYLVAEIPEAVGRALHGLQRVTNIVRAMREFAYPDHTDQIAADLNRSITNTLAVSCHEYKYVAEVVTELGAIPLVTCHVGELNQAILNLVINAAHAIEDAVLTDPERKGRITITTRQVAAQVVITVADNGCGMISAIRDRIFDPFFTTKPLGKGTGQGLAIARSVVVEKHSGRLTVESYPGLGSTFAIWLPVAGIHDEELRHAS